MQSCAGVSTYWVNEHKADCVNHYEPVGRVLLRVAIRGVVIQQVAFSKIIKERRVTLQTGQDTGRNACEDDEGEDIERIYELRVVCMVLVLLLSGAKLWVAFNAIILI